MITTLTGNNHFQIIQKLNELSSKFIKQYNDLAVERLDGEEAEIGPINEALQNLPFLLEKKLVILRDPSKNKQFSEKIEQIISSIPDSIEVVIIESKIDKRQNYFKVLKSKTEFRELSEQDDITLAKWLSESAKKAGGQLGFGEARYLIDRVGVNQELLFNELNKLLIYQPSVTRGTIDLLTEPSPQSSIFDLLDTAFSGNSEKTMALYNEQRQKRVEPLEIMAMIGWQLHILATIKAGGQRSIDDIAKEAKLNPFVVRKSYEIAHNLSLAELKALINRALKQDVSLKSQIIDADDAMRHFLLSLAS